MKALLLALSFVLAASAAGAAGYDGLNIGIQYFNQGKWPDAISRLDGALTDPALTANQRFIARYDRGESYAQIGKYDLAIADYSAALELRPRDPWALLRRATTAIRAGKLDTASTDVDAVIELRPTLLSARRDRILIHMLQGLTANAGDDFKSALSLLPDEAHGVRLGIIAWQAGNVEDADNNFRAGIDQKNDTVSSMSSWIWYALTQARLGKDVPRRALPDAGRKAWPSPVADFFLGAIPENAVFAAASMGEGDAVAGRLCEANFFIGEWKLRHKKETEAFPLLRKAAADCPIDYVLWGIALTDTMNPP